MNGPYDNNFLGGAIRLGTEIYPLEGRYSGMNQTVIPELSVEARTILIRYAPIYQISFSQELISDKIRVTLMFCDLSRKVTVFDYTTDDYFRRPCRDTMLRLDAVV